MNTEQILNGLRDVEGIIGSFVVSSGAEVVGRDLPPMFDDETLRGVAPRLIRLRDGIGSDSVEPASMVLRYSEHKIHLRSAGSGLLCVISESKVNTPALRVGMKLVARRVAPLVEREAGSGRHPDAGSEAPVPLTQRSQAVAPPVSAPTAATPSQSASSGMIYRGVRVPG